jgi:Flp pilus assembly protein TadB
VSLSYLETRGMDILRRTMLLIDARHGVKPQDEAVMASFDARAVPYQVGGYGVVEVLVLLLVVALVVVALVVVVVVALVVVVVVVALVVVVVVVVVGWCRVGGKEGDGLVTPGP